MTFFISFSENLGKILDKESLIKFILSRWPNTIFEEIDNPERIFILEWEFINNQEYLMGKLSRDEELIVLEFSSLKIGANFALCLYKNVIKKDSIIIYDSNYSEVIPLNDSTTENDIAQYFA